LVRLSVVYPWTISRPSKVSSASLSALARKRRSPSLKLSSPKSELPACWIAFWRSRSSSSGTGSRPNALARRPIRLITFTPKGRCGFPTWTFAACVMLSGPGTRLSHGAWVDRRISPNSQYVTGDL
jgi:hypothetical protein